MSFRSLVIALTFLALLFMGLRLSMDSDTWWQLRAGETLVNEGRIPTQDEWSYTRDGQEWTYPSTAWLSQGQLFLIYDALGPGGLNIWVAALVALAFGFVYPAMSGEPILRFAVLILAAAAAAIYWAARPYMVSFALSGAFLWLLEDYRWGRGRKLIWLPILMVVWVNSHPGFGVGFLLLAVYIGDQALRWAYAKWQGGRVKEKQSRQDLGNLLLVALGLLVAVCINPAGPAVLAYPFETLSIGVLRDYILEWQSPNFHSAIAIPFAILLLVTIAAIGSAGRRLALSDLLLVSLSLMMSLLAARNIPLFAQIAAIVITRYAQPWLRDTAKAFGLKPGTAEGKTWQKWLNVALVTVFASLVAWRAANLFSEAANRKAIEGGMPIGAVEYLQEQKPLGALFNSYNWGGYLLWNLRAYPVYVDGRTDLYDDGLLNEWLQIVNAEAGWQAKLQERDVNLILIEPTWALNRVLPYEDWIILYQDEGSVLYGRQPQ